MALNADEILEAIADGGTLQPHECKGRGLNSLIKRGEIQLYEDRRGGLCYGKPGIESDRLRKVDPMVKR